MLDNRAGHWLLYSLLCSTKQRYLKMGLRIIFHVAYSPGSWEGMGESSWFIQMQNIQYLVFKCLLSVLSFWRTGDPGGILQGHNDLRILRANAQPTQTTCFLSPSSESCFMLVSRCALVLWIWAEVQDEPPTHRDTAWGSWMPTWDGERSERLGNASAPCAWSQALGKLFYWGQRIHPLKTLGVVSMKSCPQFPSSPLSCNGDMRQTETQTPKGVHWAAWIRVATA